jgi:SAM-dependent methyltransferase
MPATMPNSYSERFQDAAAVADYESKEYGAGSYSSRIWQMQRPVVEKIIADFRGERAGPVRLLDFACGTGRVISALESLVDAAEGIDISLNMVAVAREKCRRASLRVGDILTQPELLSGKFDIITAFRFLLNVEPAVRRCVLKKLREVLCAPDGLLIVNVHGNSRSLRHPAIVWRRRSQRSQPTGAMLNEMSPAETRQLLHDCGFQIVRQFGFGVLPPTLYRTPLCGVAAAVDDALAGENGWKNYSIDLLFVCRPV